MARDPSLPALVKPPTETLSSGLVVANRPESITGCFASWNEATSQQVIRTSMDTGVVRVRRRFTHIIRQAQVNVTLERKYYQDFMDWIILRCQGGVLPTYVKEPDGSEQIWRIISIPSVDWVDKNAFRTTLSLEKMPEWP